ncbi:MAG: tRNA uridine-5-carboxymethylaminomethyl(34) synthesis GTPase MnmE [Elainellaceae cyanobacterium]
MTTTDTIAAIATAVVPQQGSVSIVRVSGPEAMAVARRLFHAPGQQPWESHRIVYGSVRHPQTQRIVDEALLLIMQAPRSYTREDVVEFHCHGGLMAVQNVLTLCLEQGARLAQAGEFTLRAFLNGRLDLTQAESVSDLVGAESPQAAELALAGIQGKLAAPIRQLRQTCLEILAEVEARIDFEDDLPPLDEDWVKEQLRAVLATVAQVLATADRGELLRSGLKVAIVGRPNVGKSSLLNAWSRSDRAIVTDLPGTTRDVVESRLLVGGIPVQVLDTAGIREATDQVEQIGVARSRQAAQAADLVLLVVDAIAGWTPADQMIYEQVNPVKTKGLILVINKIDLIDAGLEKDNINGWPDLPCPVVKTAAARQEGVEALESEILTLVQAESVMSANLDLAINQRQAAALLRAKNALQQVETTIADRLPLDFWTIDLREAVRALGEITGEEVTESMLDQIFSKFCIGK